MVSIVTWCFGLLIYYCSYVSDRTKSCGFPRMVNHQRANQHFLYCRCFFVFVFCLLSFHPANLGNDSPLCRYLWSGPGHAAVLRGGAGDARNLAEPGLEQQDKRCLGGLLKVTFKHGTNLRCWMLRWSNLVSSTVDGGNPENRLGWTSLDAWDMCMCV